MPIRKDKLISAFIIAFLFVFIAVGVISAIAPTAKAADVSQPSLPSGSLVEGYEIKNLSVIQNAFDSAGGFETYQTFSNCGYFAWVTHDITVTDTMGNQGSFDYDDFVVVCLFCPENASSQAEIGNFQGNQYFGVPDSNSKSNPYSPPHWRVVIGRIKGSGSNQYVEYSHPLETFNYDNHWDFPLNSADKPPLYYNFPSLLYGIPSDFSAHGEIASYGAVDSVSDAGVLEAMYDITFTPTKIMPANASFPLLNQELAVAPTAVFDDTGYNLISLQVPQLGHYTDVVVYGKFTFKAQDVSKYSFDKLKLSFGTDKIPTYGEDYTGEITNDEFSATFAGYELTEQTTTVNHLSFFYNTIIQNYSNVELASFDYSTNTTGSYPGGEFYAIGSINGQSAGAFCYNFTYAEINDVEKKRPLTPDEIDDLSDSGDDESNRKKQKLGYVPKNFEGNNLNADFGSWDTPSPYDFSVLSTLLEAIFNPFVVTLMTACIVIGIIGYVLYGKN